MEERTYVAAGMSCAHCERAIHEEVARVPGVESVTADHRTKRVVVRGERLDDAALRAAVEEAGYEAVPA
jgi:copper chaperone CopZ